MTHLRKISGILIIISGLFLVVSYLNWRYTTIINWGIPTVSILSHLYSILIVTFILCLSIGAGRAVIRRELQNYQGNIFLPIFTIIFCSSSMILSLRFLQIIRMNIFLGSHFENFIIGFILCVAGGLIWSRFTGESGTGVNKAMRRITS